MISLNKIKTLGVHSLIVAYAVTTSGCSDPMEANKANLTAALSDWEKHRADNGDYCVGSESYPYSVMLHSLAMKNDKAHTGPLGTVGLITKVGEQGRGVSQVLIMDLTEKGKKYFEEGKGFCYGVPIIARINNFTLPQNSDTGARTKVHFEYQWTEVPEWVNEMASQDPSKDRRYNYFRKVVRDSKEPAEYNTTLVLTNNGWTHPDLLNK